MEGYILFIWTWVWVAVGFVAGIVWCGLEGKSKNIDDMLERKFGCNTCPVNHIKEKIES